MLLSISLYAETKSTIAAVNAPTANATHPIGPKAAFKEAPKVILAVAPFIAAAVCPSKAILEATALTPISLMEVLADTIIGISMAIADTIANILSPRGLDSSFQVSIIPDTVVTTVAIVPKTSANLTILSWVDKTFIPVFSKKSCKFC